MSKVWLNTCTFSRWVWYSCRPLWQRSLLGRNTLLCCSHFGWKFIDFVSGSIDLSNGTLLRRHHTLVNSCDCHTVQFLSEIINVRGDVFSLHFSDGFTLSCQELNTIVLFSETDRQTW